MARQRTLFALQRMESIGWLSMIALLVLLAVLLTRTS